MNDVVRGPPRWSAMGAFAIEECWVALHMHIPSYCCGQRLDMQIGDGCPHRWGGSEDSHMRFAPIDVVSSRPCSLTMGACAAGDVGLSSTCVSPRVDVVNVPPSTCAMGAFTVGGAGVSSTCAAHPDDVVRVPPSSWAMCNPVVGKNRGPPTCAARPDDCASQRNGATGAITTAGVGLSSNVHRYY